MPTQTGTGAAAMALAIRSLSNHARSTWEPPPRTRQIASTPSRIKSHMAASTCSSSRSPCILAEARITLKPKEDDDKARLPNHGVDLRDLPTSVISLHKLAVEVAGAESALFGY